MEPRPPKGAKPTPPRQPQQPAPGWEQSAPQNRPANPPAESGYGPAPRYPAPGYPGYEQPPGYGQPGYSPPPQGPQDPGYAPRYPAPGYNQPGYPPPQAPADAYPGYGQPGYVPQPQPGGVYPPYNQGDPYAGYQQPGYTPPPAQPGQPQSRSGGWIAHLPDEDLNSTSQPAYGAGYGKGGFSNDPRSGRAAGPPNRQTQIIAAPQGEPSPTVTTDEVAQATEPPADATGDENGEDGEEPVATEPPAEPTATSPPQAVLFEGELTELLPTADDLPAGFAATSDPVRLQRAEVAANLDSANATAVEEQLRDWRFERHWRQEFVVAEADYDVDETSVLFVSMNSFNLESGASAALQLFVSAAESLGMVRAEGVELGDESVMLTSESNGNAVVIYVRQGNVLMRMYGYSEQGDPTEDVIALTEAVLAKFP